MELENKDILERNVSEKMCSSGSNGAGKICSPGTVDTCGDGSTAVKKIEIIRPKVAEIKGFRGICDGMAGSGNPFLSF